MGGESCVKLTVAASTPFYVPLPPGAGAEEMSKSMWNNDSRFLSIAREHIEALTLDDVRSAVMAQMTTDSTEVRVPRCVGASLQRLPPPQPLPR
jgi:hypothetical protein